MMPAALKIKEQQMLKKNDTTVGEILKEALKFYLRSPATLIGEILGIIGIVFLCWSTLMIGYAIGGA